MTETEEELDRARAEEALRLVGLSLCLDYVSGTLAQNACGHAARLAREGWTPTDNLLIEAREAAAQYWEAQGLSQWAENCRSGKCDGDDEVRAALIALKNRGAKK